MPSLYIENVPEDLYESLKRRAQGHGRSITAEALTLLRENLPTPSELPRRRKFVQQARKFRMQKTAGRGPFDSSEELQRKDRER